MTRFDERPPQLPDILGRFEAHSHQTHVHNARAAIGRLKSEGRRFWQDGSPQLGRWEKGCQDLVSFPTRIGTRRYSKKQDLATVMREFISEFEHTTGRMYQMLDGEDTDPEDDERLTQIFDWINLVFRSFTYALVSGWIDDKQDDYLINITVNVITGESSQETTGTGMTVPKKYQRATKPI